MPLKGQLKKQAVENIFRENAMEIQEYPSQYQSSEEGSASSQKNFLKSSKSQLIIISLVAALGGVMYPIMWKGTNVFIIITAALLIINLIVSFIDRSRKFSEKWYACRTVAESTKKITWQYMMGAGNYEIKDDKEANKKFTTDLEAIRNKNKEAGEAMSCYPGTGTQITDKMKEIRNLDWKKKLEFYKEFRLENQRKWYSNKASFNKKREDYWFYLGIAFQLTAIILGLLFISGYSGYNPIGFLMTLTAAIVAWSQIKRHKQLAISYNSVALQLADVKSLIENADSEKDFSEQVQQVEELISRENTYWRAIII